MIRILGCITQQHDLRLLGFAVAICCLACFTTTNMLSRAASHHGRIRTAWLLAAALVFGCGVWTTHFVAMLAFLSDLVLGYSPTLTMLSFLMMCGGAAVAFWLVMNGTRRVARCIGSGAVLGGSVAAMHYCGISAMWLGGARSFQPEYVVASLLAAIVLSSLALRDIGSQHGLYQSAARAGLLAASVVALHFTGMAALTIEPGQMDAPSGLLIGSTLLVTIVIAVSAIILILSLFSSFVDQHLSSRLSVEARNMHHLAHHDALTGLPNRLQCHERLASFAATLARPGGGVAILCLDLDRFKQVNDLLGHWAGDQLLVQVGARLQSLVRSTDMVARISGDEFVIAVPAPISVASVGALAGRIVDALTVPFRLDGQQIHIGTSVGVAVGPEDGATGADLLLNADAALYQAKKEGRGTYRFFEAAMGERVRLRQVLEQDLRIGIRAGQLELHYQPLLDIQTQEIVSFEALVRWRHPTRGLLSPADFIPLAEDSGLILPLGRWVLETACREAVSWDAPLRIAVNLSPIQFGQPDLVEQTIDILAKTGLPPSRLELEVTESVLIRHAEQALKMLQRLKELGVNVSLDDFGTGYSSLGYLRRFPFDKIKLDRSFIQALGENEEAAVITKAIVALGHSLNLVVTAEGVETAEQLAFLEGEDCNQVQGYLISEPLPAGRLAGLLASHRTSQRLRREPCGPTPITNENVTLDESDQSAMRSA